MTTSASDSEKYIRNPDIVFRNMDGSGFLADQNNDAMYYLNETGTAIWHFLQDPAAVTDIITTMQAAFPDTPEQQIEQDIRTTFMRLVEKGMVIPEQ
ncbi:PqqD family protein [Solemya velesiana gill symbiont]|uniref:PqqD family protein n=1 Tax=Solemya velesiana gill symbiont TaxID=1918948 RepID=A0A1T2KVF5_9GAMM|nr:PqqD family protein [Solemya velesiana gill symbiont]OOZ36829.1 hypothetical protein BOW51_05435 [Solemya velesiana gill symbiont]